MNVLQGILSESKEYYLDAKKQIENKLASLSKGSIKKRDIGGKSYYYLQYRKDSKVIHKYLGKNKPSAILKEIKERKALREELRKIKESLKIIRRSEGRKHG